MKETILDINIINVINIRCEFIDLLEYLENISIDYADLNIFENFIYINNNNNDAYKISKIINNNETYSFQYIISNGSYINIPTAEFIPDIIYDFEIDLINKKFKKNDEFKTVNLENQIIINIEDDKKIIKKNKSIFRKILGC